MAVWIKVALGMEMGLSPGQMGTQLPSPKRGQSSPIFGPILLWPNGWIYQDTTWYGGRPQPRRHCVRWGPSSPSLKGHSPQFSADVCCGQTAGWTKMPLDMEVGLGPGDFVLDWDSAPPRKKWHSPLPNFWPMSLVAKQLDGCRCHLIRGKPRPR